MATRRSVPSDDPERAVARVAAVGARLLRRTGRRCVGAGLAVPSAVAQPEGTAVSPLYVGWPTGTPICDIFTRQVARAGITGPGGRPVACWADNDINLAALADAIARAASDVAPAG